MQDSVAHQSIDDIPSPSLFPIRRAAHEQFQRTLEGTTRALARGLIGMMNKPEHPSTPFTTTFEVGYERHLDQETLEDSLKTVDEHRKDVMDVYLPEWRLHVKEHIECLDGLRCFEEMYPPGKHNAARTSSPREGDGEEKSSHRLVELIEKRDGYATWDDEMLSESDTSTPDLSPRSNCQELPLEDCLPRVEEITNVIRFAVNDLHDAYRKIIAERKARSVQVMGGPIASNASQPGNDESWVGEYVLIDATEEEGV
ncbi:hypothetical protein CVT24_012769 [Panaeolus cyanescens]|uniref:Uncharacterized protein n=1 Tax=Panaeolus cyanescens TaxID=181874 RepID=A0A409YJJ0_9AGAR|nr:hypothetical protein CVT24_012769 [Panaeolus cyanescens]